MAQDRSTIRMNLANSLFYQEKYTEADELYAQSIKEMYDQLDENANADSKLGIKRKLGQALMLRAYSLEKLGSSKAAIVCLEEGIEFYESGNGQRLPFNALLDQIDFHGKAAEVYDHLHVPTKALEHANSAIEALCKTVHTQEADRYWESLLGQWQRLPGRKVRNELLVRDRGFAKRALITAEAAKGRLLYRQMQGEKGKSDFDALDEKRQAVSVKQVSSWCQHSHKSRCVVSLFATLDGLVFFVMHQGGKIETKCESRFAYLQWLKRRMDPWDDVLKRYDSQQFAPIAQGVLGELGNALWRTYPAIAKGGDDLILIPHKALRNLPIQHIILPSGQRLSELFDRIFIYPTMWDFAECLQDSKTQFTTTTISACVDPDGSLPFARLEGWLCCEPNRLFTGKQVTSSTINRASRDTNVLLLSCHGSYNMLDPWLSALHLSNEDLSVMDCVDRWHLPDIVILGACESGLSRRSASDEPVSFAGVLLKRQVKAVVAPLWPVDDCASALFMTQLFKELRTCGDISKAINTASTNLRVMSVNQALEQIDSWIKKISTSNKNRLNEEKILNHLFQVNDWLSSLSGETRPWTMLDWGAYQLVGGYTELD